MKLYNILQQYKRQDKKLWTMAERCLYILLN